MDVVYVQSDENSVYVEYKIAGSDFVVGNLETACLVNNERVILHYKIIPPRRVQPIQSEQGLSEYELNDAKPMCITTSSNVAAVCMACLQESMEARSLFRFHLLDPRRADSILIIFFGTKFTEVPKEFCIKLCPSLQVIQTNPLIICTQVARNLPFRKDDTSTSLSNSDRNSATRAFAVGGSSRTDLPPFQHGQHIIYHSIKGLKLSKSLVGHQILKCRLCLVMAFQHALLPSDGKEYCIYLIHPVSKQRVEMRPCLGVCGDVAVMDRDSSECQLEVKNHRLPFPAAEQFLAQMPSRRRQNTVAATPKLSMSSGCIWVQSEVKEKNDNYNDRCMECIRVITSLTMFQLSDATAIAAIHPLQRRDDGRKLQLAMCVSDSKCLQLLFFPNAMCFYEMNLRILANVTKYRSPYSHLAISADHIQLMEDYRNEQASTSNVTRTPVTNTWDLTTSSAHLNHSQHIGNLRHHSTSRRSYVAQSANVAPFGDTGETLNLFPLSPGFEHTEKLHQSISEARMKNASFQKDHWLAASSDSSAFANVEGSHITNVLVVTWNKYSVGCIRCLAQHAEVLLFSLIRSYAWLISGTHSAIAWGCTECQGVQLGSPVELDIYPRRPISFASITSILSTKENMG
ncbi:hypothetical protein ABG067_002076 [Albugo candida]